MFTKTYLTNFLKCCNKVDFSVRYSSRLKIVDINDNKQIGSLAIIKGWVSAIRKLKQDIFVDVNDGSCHRVIQIVLPRNQVPVNLSYGCSVEARGTLLIGQNHHFELSASEIKVIGQCPLGKEYPFAPRKSYDSEYARQYLHLRPRAAKFSSLLRVRHCLSSSIHNFFKQNGYFFVHTPILTSNDCEGAGETFCVSSDNKKLLDEKQNCDTPVSFFGKKAYMTVSGQLHLEAVARGLGQVYNFGPIFRAENSKSRLHLSEFYMVEAEKAFIDSLEDVISLCENMLRTITMEVINECSEDVHICRQTDNMTVNSYEKLENLLNKPFKVVTYSEASEILVKNSKKLQTNFEFGLPFSKEQELFLVKHNGDHPMFVINWPKSCKPFYMKTLASEPDKVMAFDLLCPNVGEVCGGSMREDDVNNLRNSLEKENLHEKLGWYMQLREFGNAPTGGFGLGFERYLQVLLHIVNIKDTIPFPRWPHNCSL